MTAPAVAPLLARLRMRRDDAKLAAVLLVAAELEVVLAVEEKPLVAAATALVMNGALAWRRQAPTVVALVVLAGFGVQTAAGVPQNAQVAVLLTFLVAMYSVGAYQPIRRAVAGLLLAVVLPAGLAVAEDSSAGDVAFAGLLVAAPWAAGALVRRQEEQATASETRARLAEAQAALQARLAVDAERARIARELHDVVSHNLSAVVVQAAAAEALLADDPAEAREPVRAIQAIGRLALEDMGRLLGLLRAGTAEGDRTPQPSLADLEQLVDQARATGQDVELLVEGAPRQLPRGVDLSAYRIVQESLTNARRHAAGARVRVVVRHDRDALRLVVDDTGGTRQDASGAGHGLVGMRERVALYGGDLVAGPHDGGWQVSACFPLEPVS